MRAIQSPWFWSGFLIGLGLCGLLFGCTGCASLWWRDQEIATGRANCTCCYTGSQWGEAKGCMLWVCDGQKCPEKAP